MEHPVIPIKHPEVLLGTVTSTWDNCTTNTIATLCLPTNAIIRDPVNNQHEGVHLIHEEFESDDGDIYQICKVCHNHVLKTVMVDDNTGHGIHEELVCTYCE